MKHHHHRLCLSFFILFLQIRWLAADGDAFVRSKGIHFNLHGSPFYANGFNADWLMYAASDPSQRAKVSAVFREAVLHGLTVARTWAFSDGGYRSLQFYPGSYNEQMFKGLDFVISESKRYGIKLILSLVNNHESFGGKKQYVQWARSQGQRINSDDDFFRNSVVRGFYKNHIKTVLNRYNTFTGVVYKDDPTIMAWELMNEPRCPSDPSGRTIQAWIAEMAAYVKSIDRNHLLEAGLEGFYGPSTAWRTHLNPGINAGTDFIENNWIHDIDFATVHSYPDQWVSHLSSRDQLSFLSNWLGAHIQDAEHILHKPLLITEFGKSWKNPSFIPHQRDALFNIVYSHIYASAKRGGAAAGGLLWQLLAPGMNSFKDGYEITLDKNSSISKLIAKHAHKMHQIRRMFIRMKNLEKWRRVQAIWKKRIGH